MFKQLLEGLFGGRKQPLMPVNQLAENKEWQPLHTAKQGIRDIDLSLWMSAAEEAVQKSLPDGTKLREVFQHPLVQGTLEHAKRATQNKTIAHPEKLKTVQDHFEAHVHKSLLFFQRSKARIYKDKVAEEAAQQEIKRRKYEDGDPLFLTVIPIFEAYYVGGIRNPIYRDWKKEGKGNLDYGVIPWTLPAGAKVGIIADWGTGMEDSEALLADLVKKEPDAIIHLGDIYYAGTLTQARNNYLDIFDRVFADCRPGKPRIPIFNMGGNHDYYARGTGFNESLDQGNAGLPKQYAQEASYFCLRSEDLNWQIIGMDTGVNDYRVSDYFSKKYRGPSLEESEIAWHKDKLSDDPKNAKRTMLLSHHQLFSQWGVGSTNAENCYLNDRLLEIFSPYFKDKIALWMWGHEHSLGIFHDGLFGLKKGRLFGCSAYEQPSADKKPPFGEKVPIQPVELGSLEGFANHAYALMTFPKADSETKSVEITYYQMASWGKDQNANPPIWKGDPILFTETIE